MHAGHFSSQTNLILNFEIVLRIDQQMALSSIWRPTAIYWCIYQTKSNTNQNQFRALTTMEKVAPNSKFFGHSTEIIGQSKIKGPLLLLKNRWANIPFQ